MSHSSGIPVSEALAEAFRNAVSNPNSRLIKVQIQDDSLVPIAEDTASGTFEQDLSKIPALLDADTPCYVLFRQDDTAQFIILCYVPSKSSVKHKMLYASSRSNLKNQLGSNSFTDEVFGDGPKDFTPEGYKHHVTSKNVEAPLTDQEQIKKAERESGEIYSGGASTYVHGVTFPVDNAVIDACKKIISGSLSYVCVAIDMTAERIILDGTDNVDLDGLRGKIKVDEPRFHFFRYTHDFEGSQVNSIVYVYSCPDGSRGTKSAPVRMRMLYSSSKANVGSIMTSSGGTIDARLEINTSDEIVEDELMTQLHPVKAEATKNFSRPSRPGKGGARMIKSPK
eukprot:TRINITY_DN1389_c0_g1_i1.p1 TRINITY_DN1389_c0_g1~~TRINITY_DN1389_c0_g1_i1.p1  ORF type:complete len:339 (+),score=95.46 TRINITY_DN1389_c0_g1_i1:88-1104(+)